MNTQTIFKPEQLKTFNFPVKREELHNSKGSDTGFDNIFDSRSGNSLGVVSREYKLVRHEEAIFNVLDAFAKNGLPKVAPVNIRMADAGARMYAEFRFKQEMELGFSAVENPKVGDIIAPGFKICNSYDRSLKYGLSAYVLRLVCTNGMTVADSLYAENKRHVKNFEIEALVNRFIEKFENFDRKVLPHVVALSQQEVNPAVLQERLNDVPGFMQDETLNYLEKNNFVKFNEVEGETEVDMVKKMSSWDLLNSFTYVLSHSVSVSEGRRSDLSQAVSERFGF